MAKVTKVKYFTPEKLALINPKNLEYYEKYLKSNIIKNKEVKDTTYYVYQNFMNHFLVYLAEEWDNIDTFRQRFRDRPQIIRTREFGDYKDIRYSRRYRRC